MKEEEINCLKQGGVAADTREAIWRDTAMLAPAKDIAFVDVEEDEDELEENKHVLEDW